MFSSPALAFIERDPGLSMPAPKETVPHPELFLVSIGLPTILIALVHIRHIIIAHRRQRVSADKEPEDAASLRSWRRLFISASWLMVTLTQGLAITFCGIMLLKSLTGMHRPSFFALCNYKGYRDCLNGSAEHCEKYFQSTRPGVFGSLKHCKGTAWDVADAQHSFVSGHSAVAFCGMMFTVLYLRSALGVPHGIFLSLRGLATASPLPIAILIAVSRIRDYRHRVGDVLGGATIGIVAAVFSWRHYINRRRMGLAPHLHQELAENRAKAQTGRLHMRSASMRSFSESERNLLDKR